MERATGIGGVLFRTPDQQATVSWYEKHLGLTPGPGFPGSIFKWSGGEETIWATFPTETDDFGPGDQQVMLNYIVPDLAAMIEQLKAGGVEVIEEQDHNEFGKFGWAVDGDGRRFELWEPPAKASP